MTEQERETIRYRMQIAKQLGEWEPTQIKIDKANGYVEFLAYGRTPYWAKLTPSGRQIKRESVRISQY